MINYRPPYANELYHHGIPGQRWGVRRGPPYPIEDTVLRKGTRLNSVNNDGSRKGLKKRQKAGRFVYTYNPDDEWDNKVYKGPFSVFLNKWASNYAKSIVYEHQYEVVEDLKMPTEKERLDGFIELYNTKKMSVVNDLTQTQKWANQAGVGGSKESKTVDLKNLKSESDYKAAYELFNRTLESYWKYASTNSYMKMMSKKYDAMVDDNNVNVYNNAHDPVIVFNAKKLKEIGDVRMVEFDEIVNNYREVADEMEKQGKKVLL